MSNNHKHYHGWILKIDGPRVSFESVPGAYTAHMSCRRHATKAAGGDPSKVIILLCRGEDLCPTKLKEEAMAA